MSLSYDELLEKMNFSLVACDPEGKIIQFNRAFCKLLGCREEGMFDTSYYSLVHPDDQSLLRNYFADLLAGKVPSQVFEIRYLHQSGKTIWCRTKAIIEDRGKERSKILIIAAEDITEQKLNVIFNRENRSKFQTLFHKAPILVALSRLKDGAYVEINDAFAKTTGYKAEEMIGKSSVELGLIHDEDRKLLMEQLRTADSVKGLEARLISRTGEEIYCLYSGEIVEIQGEKYLLSMAQNITQRKQLEIRSQEEQERFANIFNLSPVPAAIMSFSSAQITDVNSEWCRFFGFRRDEVLGKSLMELAIVSESIAEEYRQVYKKQGNLRNVEVKVKTKTGEIKTVLSSVEPYSVGGEMFGLNLMNDITEQKSIREALEQEQDRLKKMATAVPGAVCSYRVRSDGHHYMPWASPQILDVLGFSVKSVGTSTQPVVECFHEDDQERIWKEVDKSAADLSPLHLEFRYRHPAKGIIWIEVKALPTPEPDDSVLWHGIISDITQRKEAEDLILKKTDEYLALSEEYQSINNELSDSLKSLQKLNIELEEAKEKAEESDRLKSIFLSNMSHEVRTPLNAIIGFSELMDNPALTEEQRRKYFAVIRNSGERLTQLINDIIDISKIESGQMELTPGNYKLFDIVSNSIEVFKNHPMLRAKSAVQFEFRYSPELKDLTLSTDAVRLQQIIDNLVFNAIKYTPSGKIILEVEPVHAEMPEVHISVRDTGIGIPEDKQHLLFQRFRQVEEYAFHEGTGLGLSISQGLAALLGGRIWFHSEYNKGSVFTLALPVIAASTVSKNNQSETTEIPDLEGKTILIAEDDQASFDYLKDILESRKVNILHAPDGGELMQMLEDQIPDLLLLDINMPVKSGIECLKEIKDRGINVKIIGQTAYAMTGEKEVFLNAGCQEYLAKPIRRDELFKAISKVLKI